MLGRENGYTHVAIQGKDVGNQGRSFFPNLSSRNQFIRESRGGVFDILGAERAEYPFRSLESFFDIGAFGRLIGEVEDASRRAGQRVRTDLKGNFSLFPSRIRVILS